MSFDDALLTLENSTIAFSHLEDFNDPFECTALGLYDHIISTNNSNNVIQQKFSRKYIISCFTKQPLNPLMWAHYADSHNGVVIAFDMTKAGLNDGDKFVITAEKGGVQYLKDQPKDLNRCTVDFLNSVQNLTWKGDKDLLKQALLKKMDFWSYEEEVRVVKKIYPHISTYWPTSKNEYYFDEQNWKYIMPSFKPLYLLDIDSNSFVNVTFGLGAYKKLVRLQQKDKNESNQTTRLPS